MSANPLLEAALAYAARGWPVFPCNPRNKRPLLPKDKDPETGAEIPKSGGLTKASTDPEQIAAWWKKWPKALIGLATGHPTKGTETDGQPAGLRLFVLDFDPRVDAKSGEVFELGGLKAETEEQIGCELPLSLAHLTPSDGVHLFLLQGDDGPPITNRGNLPEHVDVRGLGGYVIAPPSVMADNADKGQGGKKYRVHRKAPIALAPAELLKVLREKKGAKPAAERLTNAPSSEDQDLKRSSSASPPSIDEDLRKYALAGLDAELRAVRSAPDGQRNNQLNTSALKIASLVAAGVLDGSLSRALLEQAARDNTDDDEGQLQATINSGWTAGLASPRDLKEIASAIRERSERRRSRGPSNSPRARTSPAAGKSEGFRTGRVARDDLPPSAPEEPPELDAADKARLKRISRAWFAKRLEAALELAGADADKEIRAIAWGAGRRISASFLEEGDVKEKLWALVDEAGAEATNADVDRAIDDGFNRGFDPYPTLLDLKCARYPMTDFGLAERFRDRYGADFRFTTAKGWLGWDGRRWKVLDQDEKTPPAELVAAVFDTIRAIQREGRRIAETDVTHRLVTLPNSKGKRAIDEDEDPTLYALDYWMPKGRDFIRFSEALRIFGRGCEIAGKPSAIAALARRWLTVPIEDFDCEQLAINTLNWTLRFEVTHEAGGKKVRVRLDPHDRRDLLTRVAAVEYDPEAPAPLFDGLLQWAQPDPATRRYVAQVGGYAITGDTGEQLLWFHYGRGRNGKSVWLDSCCSALGDYSGTIGVESFMDQGIKKRGDAATPDLAKLGGVRMLRASEPERGAKLNAALIKLVTGGEPMSVRALHRGFFDLLPRFKLHMAGNSKPNIPDTDDGIWGRMKLVPWRRHIEKPHEDPYKDRFRAWHEPGAWPEKDRQLLNKIKASELEGVFRRLVEGLVDYLEHGLVEPTEVAIATDDYREKSDPLGRFLRLCTEPDDKERVKSSELYAVYEAWCKAAGVTPWKPNGFADAMEDKGITKVRSDGMRWQGIRLIRHADDFVDPHTGNVREKLPDLDTDPDYGGSTSGAPAPARPFRDDDNDDPSF